MSRVGLRRHCAKASCGYISSYVCVRACVCVCVLCVCVRACVYVVSVRASIRELWAMREETHERRGAAQASVLSS